MKYEEFRKQYGRLPLIKTEAVMASYPGKPQILRNQLSRWKKKGLILQLKKGVFILNENDRRIFPSRFFYANQLVWPSYVSLESALGYYGIIPERVADLTSVTSKKTNCFTNVLGRFAYQQVRAGLFFGYHLIKDTSGMDVLIAEPEKALLDLFYLNAKIFRMHPEDAFRDYYRFQNTESLDTRKLARWAGIFGDNRVRLLAEKFRACIRGAK